MAFDMDGDVRLVADFVRRLRRVALHPLALDDRGGDNLPAMPGAYLRRLMMVENTLEVRPDSSATIRSPLPDEVQFESLATRVRTFTLKRDRLYWPKAFDALERLTGLHDGRLQNYSETMRGHWARVTERGTPNENAYLAGYQVGEDAEGGEGYFTDIDLAYAWLYQDVAHGDAEGTGAFGVKERFRAAVGVFAQMAVLALDTLHYINRLVAAGFLELPAGTFSDTVVVTDREYVQEVFVFDTEVGADLSVLDDVIPENLRPALAMAKKMVDKSKRASHDPQSGPQGADASAVHELEEHPGAQKGDAQPFRIPER